MEHTYDLIIVGAGLSGLSLAHFYRKLNPEADILLLEKGLRPGGAIRTFSRDGYLAEWGAHGFLDNSEASREILADTGLDRVAQRAPLGSFVRYICRRGKLVMIPQSPGRIIASSILPLSAKLRVLGELWKKPLAGEQTVSRWIEHRFGPAILPFADAVFTGTYAGDINRLCIDAVLPGIRGLEMEHGSVLRGLVRSRRKKKTENKGKKELPAMISFPEGMGRLVDVLAEDREIRYDAEANQLKVTEKGAWQVVTGNESFTGHSVAVALSVNQTLALLSTSGFPKPGAPPLAEARIANVVMGFTDTAKIPFGFGYLAPEEENRFALGALFSTHMFPGRAPLGRHMVEVLVGGRRHPERLAMNDEELVSQCYADLKQLLDLPDPPCFTRVLRPESGIPQLEMGAPRLQSWRRDLMRKMPGLYIGGFGWEGIGINDMTKTARDLAALIKKGGSHLKEAAPVKNIYF